MYVGGCDVTDSLVKEEAKTEEVEPTPVFYVSSHVKRPTHTSTRDYRLPSRLVTGHTATTTHPSREECHVINIPKPSSTEPWCLFLSLEKFSSFCPCERQATHPQVRPVFFSYRIDRWRECGRLPPSNTKLQQSLHELFSRLAVDPHELRTSHRRLPGGLPPTSRLSLLRMSSVIGLVPSPRGQARPRRKNVADSVSSSAHCGLPLCQVPVGGPGR